MKKHREKKDLTNKPAAAKAAKVKSSKPEKSVAKTVAEKSRAVELELFPAVTTTKPIERFATAPQLQPFTGMDDAQLRRLGNAENINPATNAPWVPKPIRGEYDVQATVMGALAWWRAQAEKNFNTGFPETFASQKDFTARTGLPLSLLDFLRVKGFAVILPGSRVDFTAVLKAIGQLRLERADYIDGDYEVKRLNRERADEQSMLNAEKRGEVLFNEDRTLAISELSTTEVLFENFLAPFKKDLLEKAKRGGYYDQITELLDKHLKNLPPEMVDAVATK